MEIKNNELAVYMVNKEYLKHLSKIDKNVRQKDERKYYGIIVTNNKKDYCIPFTCKIKKRNKKLTINIREENTIIAQLTLNNMIPVKDSVVKLVDLKSDKDKEYLKEEIRYLRKEDVKKSILDKTENIFKVLSDEKHPDYSFFKCLCGDFKILEKECNNWTEVYK